MKEFIKINETRVRKSNVKRYIPYKEDRINVYYTTSKYKPEFDCYSFRDKEERDSVLEMLDLNFLT